MSTDLPAGERTRTVAGGLVRAAALIAVLTLFARIAGLGRIGVLAQTVGQTCLGSTYQTANQVPNIVFEVVAGGALASLVVPVLAGPLASGDRRSAERTASALLSWAVLLLVPVALAGALLARPIMSLLVGVGPAGCDRDAVIDVGASMLLVFLPQVVLYGIGIVLTGILQAQRRFLGPALVPLLSSLVVIGAYLVYGARASGAGRDLGSLPRSQELILSVGTTLGVVVLSLALLLPLRRTGLRLRPTLTFPEGVARRVRRLAAAGAVGLAAQQVSVAVWLRLANDGAPTGSALVFLYATTLFLLPYAVLAVPLATSAFPALAAAFDAGDEAGYARTAASTLRATLLVCAAGAAVLVVVAAPAARVLVANAPGAPSVDPLAAGVAALAPGLVGFGLLALLGRALYARGDGRTPAVATVTGWLVVVAADVALAALLPVADRVTALALGNTLGMTVAGALLLRGMHRATAGAGLAGAARASVAAGVGAGAAVGAGLAVAALLGPAGPALSVLHAAAAAAAAGSAFAVVLLVLDGDDLRVLLTRGRGARR